MNCGVYPMTREDGHSHPDRALKATVNGTDGGRSRDSRDEGITTYSYLGDVRSGFATDMDRLSDFDDAAFLSLDLGNSVDSQFPPRGVDFD